MLAQQLQGGIGWGRRKSTYSFYSNNNGSPLKTTIKSLKEIYDLLPEKAKIVRSCATGYGEALVKQLV